MIEKQKFLDGMEPYAVTVNAKVPELSKANLGVVAQNLAIEVIRRSKDRLAKVMEARPNEDGSADVRAELFLVSRSELEELLGGQG